MTAGPQNADEFAAAAAGMPPEIYRAFMLILGCPACQRFRALCRAVDELDHNGDVSDEDEATLRVLQARVVDAHRQQVHRAYWEWMHSREEETAR